MAKKQNIKFAIRGLKTGQFSLFPENLQGSSTNDPKMELKVGFKADKNKRMVGAFNLVTFEQEGKPLARLEVSCHFKISRLSWDKLITNDQVMNFPGTFLAHLAAITFGAARGILHARTDGTPLNDLLLPLVNFNEIVGNEVEISLTEK
jgi:hypothetical protein